MSTGGDPPGGPVYVTTHRGCDIYFSEGLNNIGSPPYSSPCVSGYYTSRSKVEDAIDEKLGPEEPDPTPDPTPDPDPTPTAPELVDTYRDVDIYWLLDLGVYRAKPADGYTAVAKSLDEIKAQIDEILEFLEDPQGGAQQPVIDSANFHLIDTYMGYNIYQNPTNGNIIVFGNDGVKHVFEESAEAQTWIQNTVAAEPLSSEDLLAKLGNLGSLKSDPTVAARISGLLEEFLSGIGLNREALEQVKTSPLNREKAAQLATTLSTAAQTGLGLVYSVGIITEVASLGQIESFVTATDMLMKNTGIDEILKPIFTAPFWSALITPTRQYWQSVYTPEIPPAMDLIRFVVREVIPKEDFIKWMKYQGFEDTWGEAYWEAHWRLPSRGELLEAMHRGELTEAQYNHYMVLHDYKPEPRGEGFPSDIAILEASRKTLIPRVDLRRGYEYGELDYTRLIKGYTDLGYEEDAELMARIQARVALEGERNAVARAAGRIYREGVKNAYKFIASELGAAETNLAAGLLTQIEYDQAVDLVYQESGEYIATQEGHLRTELTTLEITGVRADLWVRRYYLEARAPPSLGEEAAEEGGEAPDPGTEPPDVEPPEIPPPIIPVILPLQHSEMRGFNTSRTCIQWYDYTQPLSHIEIGLACGANVVRLMLSKDAWDNDHVTNTGQGYRDQIRDLTAYLQAQGVHVIASATAYIAFDETMGARQGELIMSEALQDSWISTFSDVIQYTKPDGFTLLNEPPAAVRTDTGLSDGELFTEYHAFMEKSAAAYRLIDPELTLYCMSLPFWNMSRIAAQPLSVDNVIYTFHAYASALPGSNLDPIYQALASGDLSEAARLWEREVMEPGFLGPDLQKLGIGVQAALDAGLTVFNDESGAPVLSEYAPELLELHYQLMKRKGIGYTVHSINVNPETGPHQYGILDPSGTEFNAIGEVWCRNVREDTGNL